MRGTMTSQVALGVSMSRHQVADGLSYRTGNSGIAEFCCTPGCPRKAAANTYAASIAIISYVHMDCFQHTYRHV